MSHSAASSVLLVEDNEDIREGLTILLESEGYEVVAVGAAEDGLARLQEQTFQLVVTDYMLPGQHGGWMVEEAAKGGWLRDSRVVMITAHPRVLPPSGVRILHKPLEIDRFLRTVEEELAALPPRIAQAS